MNIFSKEKILETEKGSGMDGKENLIKGKLSRSNKIIADLNVCL
jgi:hypothetical protein